MFELIQADTPNKFTRLLKEFCQRHDVIGIHYSNCGSYSALIHYR